MTAHSQKLAGLWDLQSEPGAGLTVRTSYLLDDHLVATMQQEES